MNGKIKKLKDSQGNYLFPLTLSDAVFVDENTPLSQWFEELKNKTGSSYRSYYLDLDRWQIQINPTDFSDQTIAKTTSQHLNGALLWAAQNGYAEIVLPTATYLIDEYTPVQPQSYLTINLNGSTLRIRDNDQPGYIVVDFGNNQKFSRITNGKIMGDRYTHNYSAPGNHENGEGIVVRSYSQFISIDHLEVTGFTGDSISTSAAPDETMILDGDWEQGSINSSGELIADSSKIRWANKIQIFNNPNVAQQKFVGLYGDGYGGLGSGITAWLADLYFYDANDKLLFIENNVNFFDNILIPMSPYYQSDTNYIRVVLHQSTIPSSGTSAVTVGAGLHASYVYIEKCELRHSRRTGLTPCGQYIYVLNNHIHHINSYGNPGGGPFACIDIEDGYGYNQYIYIINNNFEESPIGISLVQSRNVMMEGNRFYNVRSNTFWNECRKISFTNNIVYNAQPSGFDFQGEVIANGNKFYNSIVGVSNNKVKIIADNYFHNSILNVAQSQPYISHIDGNIFNGDSSSVLTTGLSLQVNPQQITNCSLIGLANISSDHTDGWILDHMFSAITPPLSVPFGKMINCSVVGNISFSNTAAFNHSFDFESCTFNWNNTSSAFLNAPYVKPYNGNSVTFTNCAFEITGNDNQPLFLFSNTYLDRFELVNNRITIKNASPTKSVLSLWGPSSINTLLLRNNTIISDNGNVQLFVYDHYYAPQSKFPTFILESNRIEKMALNIPSYFHDNHLINNSIDNVIDPYLNISALPTSGYYRQGSRLYNSSPAPGNYIGWVCVTAGYADMVSGWAPETSYTFANGLIFQGGHYYLIQNLGTSAGTMPTFPTASGAIVSDSSGITTWHGNTAYHVGDLVIPTVSNGFYYKCTVAGTSNATEPSWNTSGTISDGSVTWTAFQIIVWKEVGVSAVFKTYGFISP